MQLKYSVLQYKTQFIIITSSKRRKLCYVFTLLAYLQEHFKSNVQMQNDYIFARV